MRMLLKFRPGLHDSELEERLVLAGPNLGVIVLTTSGYVLMTPSAGAGGSISNLSAAGFDA